MKNKFDYELNSNTYQVKLFKNFHNNHNRSTYKFKKAAMMLKVSKFQYWWNKSFAKDFILSKYIIYFHKKLKVFLMFLEGLEALKSVALKIVCEDNVEVVSKVTVKIVTPNTADSEKHFFEGMFEEEFEIENPDAIAGALVFKKEQEINSEILNSQI